ncbi:MAG: cyclic nucleotide-binding domain-containing protein [Candidatus Sedimenticola sp. (ex Thyasira tokunagai)]
MTELITLIKQSSLFSSLSEEEIGEIRDLFTSITFETNDVIFNEGDPVTGLYILVSGSILIHRHMGGGERELKHLSPGEMFGEMGILTEDQRSATAKATCATECLEVSKENFNQILNRYRKVERQILRTLIERLKNTEENANHYILQAYKSLLLSLSSLAESRDNETGGHLHRVQGYCRLLATKLSTHEKFSEQVSGHFIESIHIVAPMHDIGKVGVPDAVLLKPGKLSKEEFAVMQTHSKIGGDIFSKVLDEIAFPTFEMGRNLAQHHHERYDGNGYPDKLAGERIPLEARIMALADVYDALLSKRVYKPAFTQEETCKIIREGRGTQFDPLLTDLMLEHIEEFEAIYGQYVGN